jgi:hypothetical protein
MTNANTLADDEQDELRLAAATMLPASEEFGVPGADDPAIFADIIRSLGRDLNDVRAALAALRVAAAGSLGPLDIDRRERVVSLVLGNGSRSAAALSRAVLQCYYRDDRVVRSLGLEPRPPFPLGHTLEQGDWSLLDAVRGRPRMWRDVG